MLLFSFFVCLFGCFFADVGNGVISCRSYEAGCITVKCIFYLSDFSGEVSEAWSLLAVCPRHTLHSASE